jgi:hypothetical protein
VTRGSGKVIALAGEGGRRIFDQPGIRIGLSRAEAEAVGCGKAKFDFEAFDPGLSDVLGGRIKGCWIEVGELYVIPVDPVSRKIHGQLVVQHGCPQAQFVVPQRVRNIDAVGDRYRNRRTRIETARAEAGGEISDLAKIGLRCSYCFCAP